MQCSIRIKANAKVNLSLKLGKKRSDGFHEIDTLMQKVALHDNLTMSISEKDSLHVSGSFSPLPVGENIVTRAISLMREYSDITQSLAVELEKNIPFGAGLAGGSSDAATALLAFKKLFELQIEQEELHKIAAKLGSDVPFFLYSGAARATGRGELLTPFPQVRAEQVLILKPNFSISTKEAYSLWDAYEEQAPLELDYIENRINDFERAIFPKYPILSEIKKELLNSGAKFALMTGSGSCICGYFDSQIGEAAHRVAKYGTVILTQLEGDMDV